ncbi:XRE family transcriptional regulator, partial [Clavibacter michiganensis subsp. insidiosus]
MDQLVIGRRIRHARKGAGLTLQALGERAGILPSQLSMIENGRRETRLSTLGRIAGALGVDVTHLLAADAPDARSALEIELDRAQRSSLYGSLGLP